MQQLLSLITQHWKRFHLLKFYMQHIYKATSWDLIHGIEMGHLTASFQKKLWHGIALFTRAINKCSCMYTSNNKKRL